MKFSKSRSVRYDAAMPFGAYIAEIMRERGWTQRQLADRLGCAHSFVAHLIDGKRNPPKSPDQLVQWADALGITGDNRERFFELADLARTPERIRRRLDQQDEEIYRLKSTAVAIFDHMRLIHGGEEIIGGDQRVAAAVERYRADLSDRQHEDR